MKINCYYMFGARNKIMWEEQRVDPPRFDKTAAVAENNKQQK